MIREIKKLTRGFLGDKYKSIRPHIPRQKETIAKAIKIVWAIFLKLLLENLFFLKVVLLFVI